MYINGVDILGWRGKGSWLMESNHIWCPRVKMGNLLQIYLWTLIDLINQEKNSHQKVSTRNPIIPYYIPGWEGLDLVVYPDAQFSLPATRPCPPIHELWEAQTTVRRPKSPFFSQVLTLWGGWLQLHISGSMSSVIPRKQDMNNSFIFWKDHSRIILVGYGVRLTKQNKVSKNHGC